jgi:hypothetical protein
LNEIDRHTGHVGDHFGNIAHAPGFATEDFDAFTSGGWIANGNINGRAVSLP